MLNTKENKVFATILADGKIHVKVPEGTPGEVKRKIERPNQPTVIVNEHVYSSVDGMITKVDIQTGKYGEQLKLTIDDGNGTPVILCGNLKTSRHAENLLAKIMNVDMTKPVTIAPYTFSPLDKPKEVKKGVSITQGDVKIQSYFFDAEKNGMQGFPKVPKTKVVDWATYYGKVRDYMIEKVKEHFNITEETTEVEPETVDELADALEEGKTF